MSIGQYHLKIFSLSEIFDTLETNFRHKFQYTCKDYWKYSKRVSTTKGSNLFARYSIPSLATIGSSVPGVSVVRESAKKNNSLDRHAPIIFTTIRVEWISSVGRISEAAPVATKFADIFFRRACGQTRVWLCLGFPPTHTVEPVHTFSLCTQAHAGFWYSVVLDECFNRHVLWLFILLHVCDSIEQHFRLFRRFFTFRVNF